MNGWTASTRAQAIQRAGLGESGRGARNGGPQGRREGRGPLPGRSRPDGKQEAPLVGFRLDPTRAFPYGPKYVLKWARGDLNPHILSDTGT